MAYSYARRNELAKQRGFSSSTEQRREMEKAATSKAMVGAVPDIRSTGGKLPLRADRDHAVVRQWHEAFYGPQKNDYTVNSPKARWFIDVLGEYTEEEWADLYPDGVRG